MATPFTAREAPRRLLLVRLSALGDVVVSLAALQALRRQLPSAEIDFAVQEELAAILRGHPDLDRVVPVPIRRWRELMGTPLGWPSLIRELRLFASGLRRRRYDCVLDLHGNLKSGIVTWMTGASLRVGPAPGESREGNWLFVDARPEPPASTRRHRRERSLALLSVLGLDPSDLDLRPLEYPRDWAMQFLGPDDGRPRVLLHPGSSPKASFKRWPPSCFASLARSLHREGVRVLLTAGPGEEELMRAVVRDSGETVEELPIPPGLVELGGLLGSVQLMVAADSGPACLADACNTPTVVLFGPKDPALYGPRRGVALRRELPCSPCGRRSCRLTRVECMEDLSPALVAEVVQSMLQGSQPPGTSRTGGVLVRVEPHECNP